MERNCRCSAAKCRDFFVTTSPNATTTEYGCCLITAVTLEPHHPHPPLTLHSPSLPTFPSPSLPPPRSPNKRGTIKVKLLHVFIYLTTLTNKSGRFYVKAPGLVQVQHRNRHIDVRALNPRPTTFRPRCGATRPPPNPTMTKTCALDAGQRDKYRINQDLKRFGTKNPCSVPHPTPPPPTPCILSIEFLLSSKIATRRPNLPTYLFQN